MIYKEGTRKPTTGVYAVVNGALRAILTVYDDARNIIWQLVRSCYGKGYWIQDKPWLDADTWKDNR